MSECAGDCDDSMATVYPGALQICDRVNNDCEDPSWPAVPAEETDNDGDNFAECQGDCDDSDPLIGPSAVEVCNEIDDNCNSLTDEDELGEDTDGDGVHNLCDNCREVYNSTQSDTDQDGYGNACDADGSLCTPTDTCQSGVCVADPSPVDCSGLNDQCNISSCNAGTGACEYSNAAIVGNACNLDDDGCTTESCQGPRAPGLKERVSR